MKKIITAIGDENLNIFLKKQNNIEVIGNDIQYQEGIFEILEKNNNIDFLIFSELIKGNLLIEKIVEKIKGYTHKRREFRILCGSRNLGRNKSVAIPKKSI